MRLAVAMSVSVELRDVFRFLGVNDLSMTLKYTNIDKVVLVQLVSRLYVHCELMSQQFCFLFCFVLFCFVLFFFFCFIPLLLVCLTSSLVWLFLTKRKQTNKQTNKQTHKSVCMCVCLSVSLSVCLLCDRNQLYMYSSVNYRYLHVFRPLISKYLAPQDFKMSK